MNTEGFWAHVDKSDGCWLWTGAHDSDGYGHLRFDGRHVLAHRLSWRLTGGSLPAGGQLDHLCRQRSCVNPLHLDPVTNAENQHRGMRAKATHCVHGHVLDEPNTYRRTRGGRSCRACNRAAVARYKAKGAVA